MDFVPYVLISKIYYDFWILEKHQIVSHYDYVVIKLLAANKKAVKFLSDFSKIQHSPNMLDFAYKI